MEKPSEVTGVYEYDDSIVLSDGTPFDPVDRYTVNLDVDEVEYSISSGATGNVANGVFMSHERLGPGFHDREIGWDDLPERVQRDIRNEIIFCRSLLKELDDLPKV